MTEESEKYLCDKCEPQPDFCEPPNMGNVLWRFPELWTDPKTNQLSSSRFATFWISFWVAVIGVHETLCGRASVITTMMTAALTIVAGIYFWNSAKDWRWRR